MGSIAKSIPRIDALEKATGKAVYGADVVLPDLLYGAVHRSPHHHARIIEIQAEEAEKFPGVVKVVTSEDIPGAKIFGPDVVDKPVIAFDLVRQAGDPIAIVVAESKEIAREAAELIEVNYEALPAVFDPMQALEEDAPQIQPDGNLLCENRHGLGDVEKGFQEADLVVEKTYTVQRIAPAYIEPEVSTASWGSDGVLKVWANTQMPVQDQKEISAVLELDLDKVQVVTPYIGGSFGGKSDATMTLLAAVAGWVVKGNVQLVNTREESMLAHPKRHPGTMKYKVGAKKDGTLVALEADFIFDTGAYASYGKAVGAISSEVAGGPYRIPNVKVRTRVAYTNSPFGGSIRGVSGPQVSFACESTMDILINELGLDPIEFRRKNMWKEGDTTYFGVKIQEEPALTLCLDEAEGIICDYPQKPWREDKLCGVGMASSLLKMGMGYGIPDDCTSRLEWLPSGKVRLYLGSPDIGQGVKTIGTQLAAELLGLNPDDIVVQDIDTLTSPNGGPTNTSRSTMILGNSLEKTAEKAVEVLIEYSCEDLHLDPEHLSYQSGEIIVDDPDQKETIHFSEIAKKANQNGVFLRAEGTARFPYPEDTPEDTPFGTHVMWCYGVHVVFAEVDPVFGDVELVDYYAIHDVGKAINPMSVEGQIEGGVAMGVGYALMEDMKLKMDNRWVDNFSEYIVPTIKDVPKIHSIIVEQPNPLGKFGVKGLGEPVTVAVAGAIANAVYSATGKRVTHLPICSSDLI